MLKNILLIVLVCGSLFAKYIKSSQGIVIDTRTLLEFEDNNDVHQSLWADAISYCKDLEYGGFKDWRLPTSVELYSIVDTTRMNPAVDESFENIEFGYYKQYWTSTINTNFEALTINFALGTTAYYEVANSNNEIINTMCVRSHNNKYVP